MTVDVVTAGRTDLSDFLSSGMLRYSQLKHNPILAFVAVDNSVTVRIIDHPVDVRALPDDTQLMQQWPGKWSSDFFRFTAADAKPYLQSPAA